MMHIYSRTNQNNHIIYIYVASAPIIHLKPSYLRQKVIGEAHELVCLIALSFTMETSSVNLTWKNFTSDDNRVTMIPTTITTDDSIGIIYTTVIQFAYLMEGDEGNYTCTLTIRGESTKSTFNLELISKCNLFNI